jgi:hypothetical protein
MIMSMSLGILSVLFAVLPSLLLGYVHVANLCLGLYHDLLEW